MKTTCFREEASRYFPVQRNQRITEFIVYHTIDLKCIKTGQTTLLARLGSVLSLRLGRCRSQNAVSGSAYATVPQRNTEKQHILTTLSPF